MTTPPLPHTTAPRGTMTGSILKMILLGAVPLIFTLNGVLGYLSRRAVDVAWVSALLGYLSQLPDDIYMAILPLNRFFWFELLILVAFIVYAIFSTTSRNPINWRRILIVGGVAAGVLLLALAAAIADSTSSEK